jgi:hypothetical protein
MAGGWISFYDIEEVASTPPPVKRKLEMKEEPHTCRREKQR